MTFTIRIAGEAGQGVATTGDVLMHSMSAAGLHVLSTQSYMSRIRGGLNWYDVRIGAEPMWAGTEKADLLVALTGEALAVLRGTVNGGAILYNGRSADGTVAIDLEAVAHATAGQKLYSNVVAAGAVFALLGLDLAVLDAYLAKEFARKGGDVVAGNQACARAGAELARAAGVRLAAPRPGVRSGEVEVRTGASAIAVAAATAGVKFVASYPMTPSTATFTHLAQWADKYGIVVEQAEDEIAAINMVIGAAYAGVPAMTTTADGGFALMVEGLSLAGMTETPAVVLLGQRPGPATGLPTRTAQQSLLFAVHAGHGEFARAVYAPGTIRQCWELTRLALETAHRWQTPVILMTDQFLQDLAQTGSPLSDQPRPIDRAIVAGSAQYARYAVTGSGVSPRAIPGGEALVVVDSDEHTEAGHLTEDLGVHLVQHDKRMRKLDGMASESLSPEFHGRPDADTLLLCWGSTYGPCREAVDILSAGGRPAGMLHFAQLWPLDRERIGRAVGSRKRVIAVEGNSTAQLAALLRGAGALGPVEKLLRYDGLPFTGEWIAQRV